MNLIPLCERGYIPDPLARFGMRRLVGQRLADEAAGDDAARLARHRALVEELRRSPVAIETQAANAQHYEVPAEFFRLHLGPRLKYSCCLYGDGAETLGEAEEAMLRLSAQRAGIRDGMRILDLGCGWGSLSLWLAEHFPAARIVALSNSTGQRRFIEARAAERGLANLRVVTGDVAAFDFPHGDVAAGFDRVMSVEMFEHMRNYAALLERIARWLAPGGELFVHLFAHRALAYSFEDRDASDWMTRHFFTGGLMPSSGLLREFPDHLRVHEQWWVPGTHYERTANDWLAGMDAARDGILAVFRQRYGAAEAAVWMQRWRMFYMAVAELFGYRGGTEWGVAHYRMVLSSPPCSS